LEDWVLNFDVMIIGASSSGLYLAELLAREGKQVGIFEREETINPARRTYIITPQINNFIKKLSEKEILHQTQIMVVETCNSKVSIPFRDGDLIMERNGLTNTLMQRAQGAGAVLHTGHRFLRFNIVDGQSICVFDARGSEINVTADFVIGADGYNSQTAKSAGIDLPSIVSIVQAEVDLPESWNSRETKVWFEVDETRFFFWLIPESPEKGVLGLVCKDPRQEKPMLDRFLNRYNIKPIAYQASKVAMHHPKLKPWGKVGSTPVYLVGDAAGQVKVTTVGGTVSGLWGSRAAARAILNHTSYSRELRSLKRELDLHWLIRYSLDKLDNKGYDLLVKCITLRVQNFLGKYNRDQMAGSFWQLPLLEPRLLLVGFKVIISILRFAIIKSARSNGVDEARN